MFKSRNRLVNFLFYILPDLISIAGVIVAGWSALKLMLFYWLDAVIMVFFMPFIFRKASKSHWHINVFTGTFPLLLFLYAMYYLVLFMGEDMGYKVNYREPFYDLINPYYQFPIILVSTFLDHWQSYNYFLSDPKEKTAASFAKDFLFRVLLVQAIIFGAFSFLSGSIPIKGLTLIPVGIIILFRAIIFFSHKLPFSKQQ